MTPSFSTLGAVGLAALALTAPSASAQGSNAMRDQLTSNSPVGDSSEGRILDGQPSDGYGFQVALRMPDQQQFCGGSLIAPRVVLTAAHCVELRPAEEITVLHGTIDLRTGGTEVGLARAPLIHPRYSDQQIDYDVAILHLDADLPGPYVALADPSGRHEKPNSDATVVGWGISDGSTGQSPEVLLEGSQTVISQDECRNRVQNWSPTLRVTDRMICGKHGKVTGGPCNGDSGGPFFVTDTTDGLPRQIGVVSWGFPGCESPEQIALYARVSELTPWITAASRKAADEEYLAEQFNDLDLEKIVLPRALPDALPFEADAWAQILPAVSDYLGFEPPKEDVRIGAMYPAGQGNGASSQSALFFTFTDFDGTTAAVVAFTEDAEYYYYGGFIPFADRAHLVLNQRLHNWHPIALLVNGKPYLFTHDNTDFVFQPFRNNDGEQVSLRTVPASADATDQ